MGSRRNGPQPPRWHWSIMKGETILHPKNPILCVTYLTAWLNMVRIRDVSLQWLRVGAFAALAQGPEGGEGDGEGGGEGPAWER